MEPTFGTRLASLRVKSKMTQDELAAKAGMSRPHLSLLESGKRPTPQRATIHKLAEALGVGEEELVPPSRRLTPITGPTMVAHRNADESETVRQLRRQNAEQAIIIERLWQRIEEFEGDLGKKPASAEAADTKVIPLWGVAA